MSSRLVAIFLSMNPSFRQCQSPRQTAPPATITHASQRFPLTASRRNIRPISAANTTLVSRKADTAAIAPDCNAHITMPYAAIETRPPTSDDEQGRRAAPNWIRLRQIVAAIRPHEGHVVDDMHES